MDDPMMGMPQDPMMGQDMADPMGGQGMEGGFDNQMDPAMGGDPNAFDGGGNDDFNQFDSNFDAGVEADEETDPKRYIQQLTGKLSQSLNKFNDEQGNDEGLSKYVGKMILAQAAKALDDSGKKELIKAINTTESDTDEDLGDDTNTEPTESDDEIFNDSEMQEPTQEPMQEPMQECRFTKRELRQLRESVNDTLFNDDRQNLGCEPNKKVKNHPLTGKILK